MELPGRLVLLTGAKRVGATIATTVAERGADVALSYNRSSAEADETAAAIRKLGRRALTVKADLADPAACAAMVEAVGKEFGRLDVLINMASLYHAVPFDELDVDGVGRAAGCRSARVVSRAVVPRCR